MVVAAAKKGLRPYRFYWAVHVTVAVVFIPILFLLIVRSAAEKRLSIGSTTFRFEYDRNSTQPRWLETQSWDPLSGEMSSGRRFSFALAGGSLSLGYVYDPTERIRASLPEDVPSLTRRLDSTDPFQIFCVAAKLSESPSNALPALPKLIAAAEHKFNVGESIELIANAAQQDAVQPLADGLRSENRLLQAYCANLLAELQTNAAAAAPVIMQALHAEPKSWIGKSALISAHFKITGDLSPTLPFIRRDLTNTTDRNEQWTMLSILRNAGAQGAEAIPETLQIAAQQRDTRNRIMALRALARMGVEETIVLPPILNALTNSDPGMKSYRSSAITALGDLGEAGIFHLATIYRSTNRLDKETAARTLARAGPCAAAAIPHINMELSSR